MKNVQIYAIYLNIISLILGFYIIAPLFSFENEAQSLIDLFFMQFDKIMFLFSLDFWLIFYLIQFRRKIDVKNIDLYLTFPYSILFVIFSHYLFFGNFNLIFI